MFKRKIAVLLVITLIIAALPGCSLFPGVKIENGSPVASGFKNSDEINAAISGFYGGIDSTLVESCPGAKITYSCRKQDGNFIISSRIERISAGIEIPELTVSKNGAVTLPAGETLDYLSDGEYVDSTLRLSERGMETDFSKFPQELTMAETYKTALKYYGSFGADDGYGELTDWQRICKLLIRAPSEESECNYGVSDFNVSALMPNLITCISAYAYGRSSGEATYADVVKMCRLFTQIRSVFKPELAPVAEEFFSETEAYLSGDESLDSPASRIGLAETFVFAYETQFGEIDVKKDAYIALYDEHSKTAMKAVVCGMMNAFPGEGTFTSNYIIHHGETASAAESLESVLVSKAYPDDLPPTPLTYGMFIKALGRTDKYFESFERPEGSPAVTDNGGDNSWYVTQMDDSEYAYMNCMPSMAAMGIKWYLGESDVTPDILRKKHNKDSAEDGGWFMHQVESCLDDYGVPFTSVGEISVEAMTAALDRGSIILTQMSEAKAGDSGHCFVIYGYRRFGDSLIFYVNDPLNTDLKAQRIDSSYAVFIIGRFASGFVEINKG